MIKFEKVSFEQYVLDSTGNPLESFSKEVQDGLKEEWQDIKLPCRATKGSAGYDFYAPYRFEVKPATVVGNEVIHRPNTVATGIKFVTDESDKVLLCIPRSGLGFRTGMRLCNTIGVIDSDYAHSKNEGHIMMKVISDKETLVDAGQRMMQGVIITFNTVTDEEAITADRDGGFGSTGK